MTPYVLIWGGGDLASGVAIRLHRVGFRVVIVETAKPLAVRRSVAFAQAVFDGSMQIEDVNGRLVSSPTDFDSVWAVGEVPVIVDPNLGLVSCYTPLVLVDARMRKEYANLSLSKAELVIGLGPGFVPGENCHAAIETNRGHFLGRVCWKESPEADTGIPGTVQSYAKERVLYAPADGEVRHRAAICDLVEKGDIVMTVDSQAVHAPFSGVLRGLIQEGIWVKKGMKVGDVDPRPDTFRCRSISEKSLAIGGGVLEAILTSKTVRLQLWKD